MTQKVVAALAAPSGAATMTQKVVAALGVFSLVSVASKDRGKQKWATAAWLIDES